MKRIAGLPKQRTRNFHFQTLKAMPDISKCLNESCEAKNTCYRYTCKPSPYWQSYTTFIPDERGVCLHFMPIYEREVRQEEK